MNFALIIGRGFCFIDPANPRHHAEYEDSEGFHKVPVQFLDKQRNGDCGTRPGLRLVHRGVRHGRLERGEDFARRAELTAQVATIQPRAFPVLATSDGSAGKELCPLFPGADVVFLGHSRERCTLRLAIKYGRLNRPYGRNMLPPMFFICSDCPDRHLSGNKHAALETHRRDVSVSCRRGCTGQRGPHSPPNQNGGHAGRGCRPFSGARDLRPWLPRPEARRLEDRVAAPGLVRDSRRCRNRPPGLSRSRGLGGGRIEPFVRRGRASHQLRLYFRPHGRHRQPVRQAAVLGKRSAQSHAGGAAGRGRDQGCAVWHLDLPRMVVSGYFQRLRGGRGRFIVSFGQRRRRRRRHHPHPHHPADHARLRLHLQPVHPASAIPRPPARPSPAFGRGAAAARASGAGATRPA